ncbi:MAG: hypothetical protein WCH46_00270 [bacterium]
MATSDNAYSDLIHLFIDGEATEVERNTLFNALKDSPELQEEFSSAMELKKAFASDIMNLQPPSYLESQIAERAGILVAVSAAAANAPVVVNAVSSAASSVAPVATGLLSKGVLTMIIGTSVGILSTVGIIKLTSNNTEKQPAPIERQVAVTQPSSRTAPTFAKADELTPLNIPQANLTEKAVATGSKTLKARTNTVQREHLNANTPIAKGTKQSIRDIATLKQNNNQPTLDQANLDANNVKPFNPSDRPKGEESTVMLIASATPKLPETHVIDRESSRLRSISQFEGMEMTTFEKFSVRVSGIALSKLYQGRTDANVPFWQDAQVALKWDFDGSNTIGAEGGNEKFPLYLSSGNGTYQDFKSIYWGGASWTRTLREFELPFGIRPEVRALAGISNAGPIFKGSIGFTMPLTARLSFLVDGEWTMLPIQSNGSNLIGNKLAAIAGLSFHF